MGSSKKTSKVSAEKKIMANVNVQQQVVGMPMGQQQVYQQQQPMESISVCWPITCYLCNWIIGIFAIMAYSEANSARDRGDYNTFARKRDSLKCLTKVAIFLWLIGVVAIIFMVVSFGSAVSSGLKQFENDMNNIDWWNK